MKNSEVVIRSAKPEDARSIQEVFYKTWLDTYPNEEFGITVDDLEDRYKDKLTPEYIEGRKKVISELSENELFIVAELGSKIVGVGYFVKEEAKNILQAMYVLPEYQRLGAGRELWKRARAFFDPAKDIFVDVVEYNSKAIKFYESIGFVDTGKRFLEERFRMKSGSVFPEIEMMLKAEV